MGEEACQDDDAKSFFYLSQLRAIDSISIANECLDIINKLTAGLSVDIAS